MFLSFLFGSVLWKLALVSPQVALIINSPWILCEAFIHAAFSLDLGVKNDNWTWYLSNNGYRLPSQGVKRTGRGVDHPPYLAPRLLFLLRAFMTCYRTNFTFTYQTLVKTWWCRSHDLAVSQSVLWGLVTRYCCSSGETTELGMCWTNRSIEIQVMNS
jgi:hypothetical protein